MPGFRLVCIGVGDAFSEKYYTTCVALEAEGQWLLLDCPHPIFKMIREAREASELDLTADKLSGLLLTHLHADHSCGIEDLTFKFQFYYQRKLPIICHPLVGARIWDDHLSAGMDQLITDTRGSTIRKTLEDFITLHPLNDERPVKFGPFSIECRRTIHHVPTFAMRIRAAGKTLGWSSDTSFDQSLIDWLSPADLIVHETNVGLHTPYPKLAALPKALRSKMRLNHYPDEFDLDASVIQPLIQGVVYEV